MTGFYPRFPISQSLLELILCEVKRIFSEQPYLSLLYQTMISTGFYGLFRVGELAKGNHVMKACIVHMANNKDKMLIVLYTSKTHGAESKPQQVKITGNQNRDASRSDRLRSNIFCPFMLMRHYIQVRGDYLMDMEQFFIFRGRVPVEPHHLTTILRKSLDLLSLNSVLYSVHSLRIGRASQMLKLGYTVEQIKLAGRWRSNAVYRYFKP